MIRILCLAFMASIAGSAIALAAPNVLVIMADDCTFNDLPMYGGENAFTPRLSALAKQGLTFNRAYLSSAMCQPCRAELYTGQFPLRNGCAWNHSASLNGTQSLPQHLQPLGYRVGIAGKVHVKTDAAYPFEAVAGFEPNCVREPTRTHDLTDIRAFMTRNRQQPFCLVVALVDPHLPWVMGDASRYPPKQIRLPPNIADTSVTRDDFSRYLAEISYMDSQVGDILDLLEETQLQDETLVLFTSEQGAQFPGCKWTNWDTGLHTALIARWPGQVPTDTRTDAIVQYADVAPTLVALAGGDPSEHAFDGYSFLPVLLGEHSEHRQFAFGIHNNVPEGPPYPIRTITNGAYRYVENLTPEEIYIERHVMGGGRLNNPYWATWLGTAADNPHTYQLVRRYTVRPAEELYHTASDPYEMVNLAGDPELKKLKESLRAELHAWRDAQGDPGIPEDTWETLEAARRGEHPFQPPGSDTDENSRNR